MTTQTERGPRGLLWRRIGWGAAALILLLPLITGAPWTLFDYIVAGALLGGAGLVLELVVWASGSLAYRAGAGLALAAAFLLIWVNGAVGFLGNEDNPANLMFAGVIAVAVLGSVIAGFKAKGMAWAMSAAAAAQVSVGVIALARGWTSPGNAGLYEVVMGTSVFSAMWILSGGLFRTAAEKATDTAVTL
ncbi:hypothetical protein [Brevundimonas sp. UBA2416]|uniref:hypothetical protein n=1 Tax=Brevundimonas sp. UBA2416 TaxID=1946124 RepID=UPI0025BE69ED|nr:hypothetical protein [Brevundimonas sp. UBA2416]HRJ63648.1 hypothetical protein [Brevundimonas sp.]